MLIAEVRKQTETLECKLQLLLKEQRYQDAQLKHQVEKIKTLTASLAALCQLACHDSSPKGKEFFLAIDESCFQIKISTSNVIDQRKTVSM